MQTIVELPEYLRQADAVLGEDEKSGIINTLARNPAAGVVVTRTGGIRKLRWSRSRPGTGKSAGVRVVYFYHDQTMPLFLLTLFAKGDKANLSKSERNELAKLAQILRSHYAGKRQ